MRAAVGRHDQGAADAAPPTRHAAFTGLMAWRRLVVPLCCGVRVGAEEDGLRVGTVVGDEGASASEQASKVAATEAIIAAARESDRVIPKLRQKGRAD